MCIRGIGDERLFQQESSEAVAYKDQQASARRWTVPFLAELFEEAVGVAAFAAVPWIVTMLL